MDKNELRDLIQFGSSKIFKATNGTIQNEDLDILLARGEKRAKETYDKIDNYIKKNKERLFDLGINSINVYEFEGDNYKQIRK